MIKTLCICDMCGKEMDIQSGWRIILRDMETDEEEYRDLCPRCREALLKYMGGYWKIDELHRMVEPTPSDHHQSHGTENGDRQHEKVALSIRQLAQKYKEEPPSVLP